MPRIHARLVRLVLGAAGAGGPSLADSCLRDSRSRQVLHGGPRRRVLLARVSDRWCSASICEGIMLDCVALPPRRYLLVAAAGGGAP